MLKLRKMIPEDWTAMEGFLRDFYHSPAALHTVPLENMERTFRAALNPEERLLEGYLALDGDTPVGYVYVTFCYSSEVGGKCVFLEEIYLSPAFRGRGHGGEILDWLRKQYPEALRFRLEVNPDNPGARRAYEKKGYQVMNYTQMVIDLA